ncbi:hypothetical protein BU26DRAFT_576595 [Trematosphaeria pertusa]|uniref:Uncharacterized protein n=1 Tax=Trematosphaeria pertusa TaxID=390896 RepID=A0A6A6I812_9PLEO|nr:uncharacterized protein BU26DRAFT_576595 [Trematosphaeria pertusa]KAF2246685.1 hypothetical protein BU26DRAFT_576595 [Trematosphaeria pertusa]
MHSRGRTGRRGSSTVSAGRAPCATPRRRGRTRANGRGPLPLSSEGRHRDIPRPMADTDSLSRSTMAIEIRGFVAELIGAPCRLAFARTIIELRKSRTAPKIEGVEGGRSGRASTSEEAVFVTMLWTGGEARTARGGLRGTQGLRARGQQGSRARASPLWDVGPARPLQHPWTSRAGIPSHPIPSHPIPSAVRRPPSVLRSALQSDHHAAGLWCCCSGPLATQDTAPSCSATASCWPEQNANPPSRRRPGTCRSYWGARNNAGPKRPYRLLAHLSCVVGLGAFP